MYARGGWAALVVAAGLAVSTGCATDVAREPDGDLAEHGAVSPFDTGHPALDKLDPELLLAVQHAAEDARADGVTVKVTSGWRSADHQQRLLDAAVAKYGSLDEARRWVNTPERSTHVTGDAVDIGPTDAADWFVRHGSDYGLCQVYVTEMWHFELLTTPGGDCPAQRADAAS